MAKYIRPKKQLHREFLYLDRDTVMNSLSALESGKVDEIIQKANAAREGGFAGGVALGPAEASGSRKKTTNIEEELVRTRTVFSGFDAWYKALDAESAIGRFDDWDQEVRNQLSVGDTIEFVGRTRLSPLHLVFRSFLSFAEQANTPGSLMQQKGQELSETKATAKKIGALLNGGPDRKSRISLYIAPCGVDAPLMVCGLSEDYLVRSGEDLEGDFRVIAQVENVLREDETVPAIRLIRDVPPTPMEIETSAEAIGHFKEGAGTLGVIITDDDILIPSPAVQIRPIAIYR